MNNAELVAVVQGVEDRLYNITSLSLGQSFSFNDMIKQFTSSAALHDEEEVLLILVHLVKFDDIGMVHLLKDVDLVL